MLAAVCRQSECPFCQSSFHAGTVVHEAHFMVLTGSRIFGLKVLARMLYPKFRLRNPACHIDSSPPLPQQKHLRSSPSSAAASAPACRRLQSTHLCRSAPSQPTDNSVLSYSSAQPYSPQQLAELRKDARDTIVALSSGSGRAGVAVIRISGPRAGMPSPCGTSLSCCDYHSAHQPDMQHCGMQMTSCERY